MRINRFGRFTPYTGRFNFCASSIYTTQSEIGLPRFVSNTTLIIEFPGAWKFLVLGSELLFGKHDIVQDFHLVKRVDVLFKVQPNLVEQLLNFLFQIGKTPGRGIDKMQPATYLQANHDYHLLAN